VSECTLSIVSHGHGPLLDRLMKDIAALPSSADSRIVLTLNVRDEAFDAADYPGLDIVVIRNEKPKGFGANHNAAFAHCRTPWFVILNPDLRFTCGDPFPALTKSAGASGLKAIAPIIVDSAGHQEDSVRSNLTPTSLLVRQLLKRKVAVDSSFPSSRGNRFYWLAGMFMMIDSGAFADVHGFDERFFLYCEDYDLCARLYARGHALGTEPSQKVIHEAQRDSHRSRQHMKWHLQSLYKVWTSRAFWRIVSMSRQPSAGMNRKAG